MAIRLGGVSTILSLFASLFAGLVHVLPHPSRASCFTRLVVVLEVQALRLSCQHLPYQVKRVAQSNEGVFASRIIDDLIDPKTKDLRGTAEQSGNRLSLYRAPSLTTISRSLPSESQRTKCRSATTLPNGIFGNVTSDN